MASGRSLPAPSVSSITPLRGGSTSTPLPSRNLSISPAALRTIDLDGWRKNVAIVVGNRSNENEAVEAGELHFDTEFVAVRSR
jgi:hypothetical protein